MLLKSRNKHRSTVGFTLLEILIALFIFAVVSVMLSTVLRSMLDTTASTDAKAEKLHQLQIALLMMSRDVEQAINRPITNGSGKEELAFEGDKQAFTLTHGGAASAMQTMTSTLQRVGYQVKNQALVRLTWEVLDQAPSSTPHVRTLLTDITALRFEYLDKTGRFSEEWPPKNDTNQPLPRAIRIYLTLANWGSMSQLIVIPIEITDLGEQKHDVPSQITT